MSHERRKHLFEAMDEYFKGLESGVVGGAMFGAPYGLARKGAKEAALETEAAKMREAAGHPKPGEETVGEAPETPPPPPPAPDMVSIMRLPTKVSGTNQ